jgi:ubiquitin-activating enzyme E1
MEDYINKDLYSRQICTYGLDTMDKILKQKYLIIGLRGLGIEIAKNLILAGPNEVSISDKNICKINDLGSNFYLCEKDVNINSLEDACYDKLKSLNPYVNVTKYKGIYGENLKKYNLIIITQIMKLEDLYEINKLCRKYNVKFIYTLNLGLTGFLFNDFGSNHHIYDSNGEKKLKYNIYSIEEKENNYEIFLDIQKDELFGLKEGDFVILKKIKGLEFLNDNNSKKIIKISNSSFEIEKNNNYNGKYISDGIVEEFKVPKKMNFEIFKENFIKPNNNYINIDTRKKSSNILLHCAFVGLHIYYSNYNKLPALNDLTQAKEIVELSKQYYFIIKEKYPDYLKLKKKNIIEFNENYIINVLRWSKSEINPICTFLGGIVSQEALKIIGKYTPIYQWLRFDFFETIENIPNKVNRNPLNCRYDDQIAIFGRELQEKLNNLNIFMVGAGALGCEYIKNFCLMGISSGNGKITITDNDNISVSNLNRQFLFHMNDIKENLSKSFCARRESMKINKDMRIQSYQLLVNNDTRNIFDDEFIDKQNILISAVDNIEARKFIDNLSTFYNKIFIDSGTEGTKANSDIYYPNESICLNDLEFNEKEEIPMCTLKLFPTKIEHCIEFSKSSFIDLFEQPINDLKLIPKNEEKFKQILEETNDQLYLHIEIYKNIFYILENPSFNLIIKFASFVFKYYFQYIINKILKDNQKSFLNQNYNKKPSPLEIDLNEKNTILFFKSFYFIISNILKFNQDFDLDKCKNIIENTKISFNDDNLGKQDLINNFKKEILIKIKKNENNIIEKLDLTNSIEFEKDNDENNHINFILSFSNLRANNYNIENTDFLKVKEIAGNIIPAIASTTASITGLACLQIYTLLNSKNLKSFRSAAFNLSTSEFDLFIPEEKRFITDETKKVIPYHHTVWDKIDIVGPNKTIKNFIDIFIKNYGITIDFINYDDKVLASPFEGEDDFDKTIEDLIKEKYKKNLNEKTKYIKLIINGSFEDENIISPTIRYILKDSNTNTIF